MEKEPEFSDITEPADDIVRLEVIADWMDSRFRIPGTQIRFGLDALIGLVPYAGDIIGFCLSGLLFSVLMKRGAGPLVLLRMMGNLVIDALAGSIPLLGDLFDVGFKANRRNVDLLRQYYAETEQPPDLGTSVLILLFLFVVFLAGLFWMTFQVVSAVWGWVVEMWHVLF
ncbi:MAG: DUF4112 domain-containing protein [Bacteroidetes bacterium]|nr:MAG: DUF4112 domain-containing protein [Bacteroidota bacterium]